MCEHTLEEVSKHCTRTSCWMVIHDKVYDITDFLDEHPGGGEVLLEYAGKDATNAFEDNGHTQEARDLAKQYFISNVADQSGPKAEGSDDKEQEDSSWNCTVS